MSTFKSLKVPAGAVVVAIGPRAFVVRTPSILRSRAKKVAHHTRRLIMGRHFFEAERDIAFVTACELVETVYALDGAFGDAAKVARLNNEAQRFAISLQEYELHPYVFISHDRTAMMTEIQPMLNIATEAEFDAWEVGLGASHYGLLGHKPAVL
ncbi:hypothetical protein SAMN04487843_101343 [Methylobacterium sp. ap11]|uniref:hypothetical protein n=1 Tax=Methylobacterium sp. ap11 TaxID=1761799 RepID=UPI0008C638B0|nr:hypothetical protein [Methylobacterium sp. ap11]SEO42439.1 hypothetical protein SAMN04487843_101343 [Methylobacterium sp. ap11]